MAVSKDIVRWSSIFVTFTLKKKNEPVKKFL